MSVERWVEDQGDETDLFARPTDASDDVPLSISRHQSLFVGMRRTDVILRGSRELNDRVVDVHG